jgi:hypothetical protein
VRAGLTAAQKFAWSPPIVPGVGNSPAWNLRQKDVAAQQILNSRDAMYGRATAQLGPVQNYISTYPGSGLTPERIASIHNEVMVAGYMLNKACLDEQILLRDAQIETVDRAVRISAPSERSIMSILVCQWMSCTSRCTRSYTWSMRACGSFCSNADRKHGSVSTSGAF